MPKRVYPTGGQPSQPPSTVGRRIKPDTLYPPCPCSTYDGGPRFADLVEERAERLAVEALLCALVDTVTSYGTWNAGEGEGGDIVCRLFELAEERGLNVPTTWRGKRS